MFDRFLNNNFAAFNEKLGIERFEAALDLIIYSIKRFMQLLYLLFSTVAHCQ